MSQHIFDTAHKGELVQVVMGWDRPLKRPFMFVEKGVSVSGEEEFLYNNMFDPDSFEAELGYFENILNDLEIKVPLVMIEQVRLDEVNNVGNRVCKYSADGELTEVMKG